MRIAIVTGASSGIGLEIVKTCIKLGYRVFGLARDFGKTEYAHDRFIRICCDVCHPDQLKEAVETAKQGGGEIHVVVNNAGVGHFGPHEQLKPSQIKTMVDTHLLAPMLLARFVLRDIKRSQGFIINISSVTAKKSSTHGCAYAATKAGLSHFGISLFDEVRKTGAKVVNIHPDLTQTPFYDRLDFREGDGPDRYITAKCVADAVETVLSQREGTVLTELTLRPQRHGIVRKKPQM